MQDRSVDCIGPFPEDADGNKYICVIIDLFSRWIELYKIKEDTAMAAAECMFEHFGRFGAPRSIRSDRGSEFVNELITAWLRLVGTTHELSVAHSHEENAIVERANGEVRKYIQNVCYDKRLGPNEWSKNLPLMMRCYNSLDKKIIGYSPEYIVYAGGINTTKSILPESNTTQEKLQELSWDTWLKNRQDAQRVAIAYAQDRTHEHQVKHIQEDNGKRTEYPVNSYVLKRPVQTVYGDGRESKLALRAKGPFKVVKVKGSDYTLLDPKDNKVLEPVKVQRLIPFHYDEKRTDPLTVRLKDYSDHYIIEKIVRHKGNLNKDKKQDLRFVVKWEGYSSLENTTEPWKNVRDSTPLHDYLRSIGEERHIPKRFREQVAN